MPWPIFISVRFSYRANRDTQGKCDALVCRSIIKAVVVVIIIDSVVKIFFIGSVPKKYRISYSYKVYLTVYSKVRFQFPVL